MAKIGQKSNARDLSFFFVIVLLHELAHTHCSLLLHKNLYEMAMATWELCLQQMYNYIGAKDVEGLFLASAIYQLANDIVRMPRICGSSMHGQSKKLLKDW
jgi:hypothetical protein